MEIVYLFLYRGAPMRNKLSLSIIIRVMDPDPLKNTHTDPDPDSTAGRAGCGFCLKTRPSLIF